MDDSQLRWLQYNHAEPGRRPKPPLTSTRSERQAAWERHRRGTVAAVGELAAESLTAAKGASGPRAQVTRALNEAVGESLLGQAEVVSVQRGILSLAVEDPAAAYQMRLWWEQVILEVLGRQLPGLGIRTVRFVAAGARR